MALHPGGKSGLQAQRRMVYHRPTRKQGWDATAPHSPHKWAGMGLDAIMEQVMAPKNDMPSPGVRGVKEQPPKERLAPATPEVFTSVEQALAGRWQDTSLWGVVVEHDAGMTCVMRGPREQCESVAASIARILYSRPEMLLRQPVQEPYRTAYALTAKASHVACSAEPPGALVAIGG